MPELPPPDHLHPSTKISTKNRLVLGGLVALGLGGLAATVRVTIIATQRAIQKLTDIPPDYREFEKQCDDLDREFQTVLLDPKLTKDERLAKYQELGRRAQGLCDKFPRIAQKDPPASAARKKTYDLLEGILQLKKRINDAHDALALEPD